MATDAIGQYLATAKKATLQTPAGAGLLAAAVHQRWTVKTGADTAAANLVGQSPTATTIAHMVTLPVPAVLPPEARTAGTEETVWQLEATLTGYKLEADGDYHLVIADGNGNTMIAEIPDPAQVSPGCSFTAQITTARQAFDSRFGALKAAPVAAGAPPAESVLTRATESVTVIGLGFFDFAHGQDGVAPNAIELHPVTSIEFHGPAQAPAGA